MEKLFVKLLTHQFSPLNFHGMPVMRNVVKIPGNKTEHGGSGFMIFL